MAAKRGAFFASAQNVSSKKIPFFLPLAFFSKAKSREVHKNQLGDIGVGSFVERNACRFIRLERKLLFTSDTAHLCPSRCLASGETSSFAFDKGGEGRTLTVFSVQSRSHWKTA